MAEIIGIDTGNRCIKTANHVFVAGVKVSDRELPFQRGILAYNDNYYMLSQKRVAYLQDKTESDEYFAMALFAIAKELESRGIPTDDTAIPVYLGVGLPPSHLYRLKNRFKNYFDRGIVTFMYDNQRIRIDIREVYVFSQGYAAIYLDYDQIKQFPKSYIIDIGGYTTDIISLNKGLIDPDFCESIDMGLIQLYNRASWKIHSKFGHIPTEEQLDEIISGGKEISEGLPVADIVTEEVTLYVSELMRRLSEYGIDLKFSKGIFVGGGSERFKKWLEKSEYVSEPYFITNIRANAQGYEAFLKSIKGRG